MDKHFSTSSPDVVWDYIVIGSGMGGLSAAALLSELGKRVLVIEQHYVPGGFTHTFKRKKWVWDVGVHAIGEVSERAMIGRVLASLTHGALQWSSLGEVYDTFSYPDGFHIDFPSDKRAFIANLATAFPRERAAIDAYISEVHNVGAAMKSYYLSRIMPWRLSPVSDRLLAKKAQGHLRFRTAEVLDRLSDDARFKCVLAAQWGYYGSPPSRSAFAIHALTAKHFWHGGYYPMGGAKRIAETLMATVASAGGWTRISSEVEEILVERERAVGVRLCDGGEVIRARAVVSAAGAIATTQRLLPAAEREALWARSISALKPSPAHVCLNIGFKGDIRSAGASASNQWFYEHWDTAHEAWHFDVADTEAPVLYTSFPSLKDPLHQAGPDVLHTGEVVTFVPWEAFAAWRDKRWMKRGEDYDALKRDLSDRLLRQLLRHMPGLAPFVSYTELSTPLSTEHFTRAPAGAIYGIEPVPERFQNRWLRPQTPIRNLYMAGGDMATVGVIGAFVGGLIAATAAEPLLALRYLRRAIDRPSAAPPASATA